MKREELDKLADEVWESVVVPGVPSEMQRMREEIQKARAADPKMTAADALGEMLGELSVIAVRMSFRATVALLAKVNGESEAGE